MVVTILLLVWFHFIADFILQTDEMAIKKSSDPLWLFFHVLGYSLPFLLFGLEFAFATFTFHFIIDFVTSKCTSYLWKKEKRHWFFVTIGFDQALHITTLILTAHYLKLLS